MAHSLWAILPRRFASDSIEDDRPQDRRHAPAGRGQPLERLTRTATATQHDLGYFLRMGLISQDDYVRLGGANLDLSWDEVLAAYVDSSYGRCQLFTHENNAARAQRIVTFLRARAPVARVTEDDIRTYLTVRSRDVSKKTLKNELDVVRQLLDYPVSRGVLRQRTLINPTRLCGPGREGLYPRSRGLPLAASHAS